jgi:predicted dehydrogenase
MTGSAFATVAAEGRPLRMLVVGAGSMGRAWLRALTAASDVVLAGIVDLDPLAARAAAVEAGVPDLPTGADLASVAAATEADAVIDVTVPAAHLPVTLQALDLGLPVLGEKPVAATLAEALRLVAATELSGRLFMVSQSRRYNRQLAHFRRLAGRLGALGILTTEFFRGPHFGGFRDAMAHPLLLDMAIHPFDSARYLLDAEPVSVYCQEYNPAWSWYAGDAATTAIFEFTGGIRYVYTGSWCSTGMETSWNGSWRLSGEHGTARWSGDDPAELEATGGPAAGGPAAGVPDAEVPEPDADPELPPELRMPSPGEGIDGSLAEFTHALRTGTVPMGEVHENVLSLAMVEAAVLSATADRRVLLDDVLETAHREAVTTAGEAVGARLRSWSSVRAALTPLRKETPGNVCDTD